MNTFNPGDLVKTTEEDICVYVGFIDGYHQVKMLAGMILSLPSHEFAPYKKLPEHADVEFGLKLGPQLVELLENAANHLFSNHFNDNIYVDKESGCVIIGKTDITVDPVIIEKQTLQGWEQTVAWQINAWHVVLACLDSPEDVQQETLSEPIESLLETVMKTIEIWQRMISNKYFEMLVCSVNHEEPY